MTIFQGKKKNIQLAIIGLIFAFTLLLLIARIQSPLNTKSQGATVGNLEAEDGIVQEPAMVHSDPTASGGKYVMFPNQSVSPTPIVTTNQPTLLESYFLTEDVNAGYYNYVKYKPPTICSRDGYTRRRE